MTPTEIAAEHFSRCPAALSHVGLRSSWSLSCDLPQGHEERLHYDRDADRMWPDS